MTKILSANDLDKTTQPDRYFKLIVYSSLLFDQFVFEEIFGDKDLAKHLWNKYRVECKSNLGAFFNVLHDEYFKILYIWMRDKADETRKKFGY